MRLILASASPRRAELLRAAGYAFEVVVAAVDESIRDGEAPSLYVRRVAAEKSAAAIQSVDGDVIVLGADTTVVVDGEILAKPRDDADAGAMMRRIAGWRKLGDYAGSERYTLGEIAKMTFANRDTQIVRPAYQSPDGAFHAHKGFNWRRLRERLREHFAVRQTRFTPFAWSGGLISSQAWFICGHR